LLEDFSKNVTRINDDLAGLPFARIDSHCEEAFEVLTDEASKGWRDRALVDALVDVVEGPSKAF